MVLAVLHAPTKQKCRSRLQTLTAVLVSVFRANIAEGSGVNLPAILGAQSMREKDAVIILRDGKECICFPGAGGYKIDWAPGAQIVPMKVGSGGHMLIEADAFDKASPATSDQMTFVTDMRNHPITESPVRSPA